MPGSIVTMTSDGRDLLVGLTDGRILGYPLNCQGDCAPIWDVRLGQGRVGDLLADARCVYASLRDGDVLMPGGVIKAYR